MTQVTLKDRSPIDTDSFPADPDELLGTIARLDVVFEPFGPAEAEVDPGCFREEIEDYLKKSFKLKRPPTARFEDGGTIGEVAYWVFSAEPAGEAVYAIMIRNICVSEVVCAEREAETGESGERHGLTPAQAALFEYCTTDYRKPKC